MFIDHIKNLSTCSITGPLAAQTAIVALVFLTSKLNCDTIFKWVLIILGRNLLLFELGLQLYYKSKFLCHDFACPVDGSVCKRADT